MPETPKKPSFKGPIAALLFSLYVMIAAFLDAFIDTEADQSGALKAFPIAVACFAASCYWIHRREESQKPPKPKRLTPEIERQKIPEHMRWRNVPLFPYYLWLHLREEERERKFREWLEKDLPKEDPPPVAWDEVEREMDRQNATSATDDRVRP